MKVASKSPSISHLLFADDGLFFCKTKEECVVVFEVFKKYEEASGQQINYSKSSIQFGHTVEISVKDELMAIFWIINIGGSGSYLSLLESLGGSKTKIFLFVRERLHEIINGWVYKFFIEGGRDVMIKPVAFA